MLLDVDRPGRYTVLKAYEHERHVFPPDGQIDADTGSRMLAMIAPADQTDQSLRRSTGTDSQINQIGTCDQRGSSARYRVPD